MPSGYKLCFSERKKPIEVNLLRPPFKPTMEAPNLNRTFPRWKKNPQSRSPILSISLFTLILSLLFFLSYKSISNSLLLPVSTSFQSLQCVKLRALGGGNNKFLWYAPHSGFSNQLSEFRNGLLMAAILNRTLIVPPVLDHHTVVLGSCPKFRVTDPKELRFSVWNHVIELVKSHRYFSMADIIDLSSLVSGSGIQIIDLRHFLSLWCDVNLDRTCFKDSDVQENLRQCGSLLSGYKGNINDCLYTVDEDCRTTVWTFQKEGKEGALDSFQPDELLKKKKEIAFVRRRKDVYNALGPGSRAESASVLAFGSLFTGPYKGSESYIDIREAPRDEKIQSFIKKIEFLPFVPEITRSGKEFSQEIIKSPFLCAQLRLLDGQFKNHWKTTFLSLKQKLESLKQMGPLPIHIFVMTDLPGSNWTGTFLGDLAADSSSFQLFVLRKEDELIERTAKKILDARHGIRFRSFLKTSYEVENHCKEQLPDIVLQIEETVCSCATLGFVGTAGSTIADSIEIMRKNGVCSG